MVHAIFQPPECLLTNLASRHVQQVKDREETLPWARARAAGWQRMRNCTPEPFDPRSSPDLTQSSALTFWLRLDNLRLQLRSHRCDLILEDKLVCVFVAKRKPELWKH